MNSGSAPPRLLSERFGLPAVFLAAAVFYLLVFNRGFNAVDEGYFLSHVELFRKGFLPYRDFYFQFTPLSFWLHGALFQLFGPALIVNRIYALVQFLGMVLLFYWNARAFTSSPYRLIPPTLLIGFSLGFGPMGHYGTDSVCVAFLTLGALIRYFRTERMAWLFAAGLLAGISFCMKQSSGGAAAMTVVFAAGLVVKERGRSASWSGLALSLGAGLIAPVLVTLAFTRHGLALEFVKATFLAGGTKSWVWRQIPRLILPALAIFALYLGSLAGLGRKIIRMSGNQALGWVAGLALLHLAGVAVIVGKGAGPFFLAAAAGLVPLGLAALSIWALRSEQKLDPGQRRAVWISAVFTLWMMVLGALSGFDFGHNLMYGVWSLALAGYLSERLARAVPESWRSKLNRALAGATVGALLLGIGLSLDNPAAFLSAEPLYQQTLPLNLPRARGIRVSPLLKEEAEGIVGVVERETRPEDAILVFPLGGIYYFLTDRVSQTYWTFLFFENFRLADCPAMIEQIERNRIPIVIVADPEGSLGSLLSIREIQPVYRHLLDRYQPGERYGRYRIYRRMAASGQ
jgi:hypothetical protein